jgi:hypothetical protein
LKIKLNSAQLELELGLSLATVLVCQTLYLVNTQNLNSCPFILVNNSALNPSQFFQINMLNHALLFELFFLVQIR